VPQDCTKCDIARHKKTLRLMCHRKAQNVPQDGTKCATVWHKKTYVPREGTKCAIVGCPFIRHIFSRERSSTGSNDCFVVVVVVVLVVVVLVFYPLVI
jgi:hypothetical protein